MNKPVLVIMAAGMGSRYGGLKQIDPVDDEGDKIIDFSIYDAKRAGFEKVIFIIKKENEDDFKAAIGEKVASNIEVEYVFQELTNIPEGKSIPEGRVKPYGTAHAVLSCKDVIDGPFAVINSDDFYGQETFKLIYDQLVSEQPDDNIMHYCMVGFKLGNTLTDNGSVSRGICSLDEKGNLKDIVERTKIIKTEKGAAFTEDGENYEDISTDSITSMNIWGFSKGFMKELESAFEKFFEEEIPVNPLKGECYLPFVVNDLLKEGKADVKVLTTSDAWFGVTYQEDKPFVKASVKALKDKGVYPQILF